MVAIAAVSKAWIAPKTPLAERIMFGTKFGAKMVDFMAAKAPEHVVQGALEGEGSLRGEELETLAKQVMEDPAQRQVVLELASTVNVGGPWKDGWLNDVKNFAAIKSLGLEQVQCPVLVVHGDADTHAVPSYSEDAHARLPLSILVMMPRGTHLCFYAHPRGPSAGDEILLGSCTASLNCARGRHDEVGETGPGCMLNPLAQSGSKGRSTAKGRIFAKEC